MNYDSESQDINILPELPAEIRTGNMDASQAIQAMKLGKIVRRFNGHAAQKFYRFDKGRVQVSNSAKTVMEGTWDWAKTDIDSWVMSTFREIKLITRVVNVEYEN